MTLNILSLGAGVQSTTMALMAAHGLITPMPDAGIFGNTWWEPKAVYDHLAWLMSPNVLPFPVHVVQNGNLRENVVGRRDATGRRYVSIPWHTINPDGTNGMSRRQCTSEYKLTPIMRKMRDLLGVGPRQRIMKGEVQVYIGISTDESYRMKPARQQWMETRWPLIEQGMSRRDCLAWLKANGYPTPPKSACIGCPFHSDAMWRDLRDNHPEEWADAVAVDAALRQGSSGGIKATEYMHPQRVPLSEVDLSTHAERGQPDLFGNECEGMCGV